MRATPAAAQIGGTVATLVQPTKTLRQAFLVCHSEGHQWRHEGMIGGSDPDARPPFQMHDAIARVSFCTSCGTQRFRWYTRSGEATNRYRHPDGYLHRKSEEHDEPAPTRLEWRQQLVVQLFDELSAPRAKRTNGQPAKRARRRGGAR